MKSKQVIGIISRIIVGLVFVASAITKYISIEAVDIFVYEHQIFSWTFTTFFTRALISLECSLGLLLLLGVYPKQIKWLTIISLVLFTVYVLLKSVLFKNVDNTNCHCFGDVLLLSDRQTVVKNIILLLISYFMFWDNGISSQTSCKVGRFLYKGKSWLCVVVFAVCFIVFNTVSMAEPLARKVYTKKNTSLDMPFFNMLMQTDSVQNLQVTHGKKLVCMYSTGCKYCKKASMRVNVVSQRYNIPDSNIAIIFWTSKAKVDTVVNQNNITDTSFVRYYPKVDSFFVKTQTKVFPHTVVPPLLFLKATKGKQPVILLMNNGKIEKILKYPNVNEKDIREFFNK